MYLIGLYLIAGTSAGLQVSHIYILKLFVSSEVGRKLYMQVCLTLF